MDTIIRIYVIPISIILFAGISIWLVQKFKGITHLQTFKPDENSKEVTTANEVQYELVEARLYDSITRTAYNTTISGDIVGDILRIYRSLGRRWLRDGKWLFAINKYQIDGETSPHYRPVESLMSATREHPPSLVHMALVHPEISVYFDVSEQKTTLQKLIPVLIFVGAMIFVMFMWSQS